MSIEDVNIKLHSIAQYIWPLLVGMMIWLFTEIYEVRHENISMQKDLERLRENQAQLIEMRSAVNDLKTELVILRTRMEEGR